MIQKDPHFDPANKYDVYWDPKKPDVTLYVPHGKGLPDVADTGDWSLDRTVYASEVPTDLAERIDTEGHAFRSASDE